MSGRISIIMPAYQAGRYIAQTLDSVVAQTYRDWVCHIVNDGSTDNTADAVRPFLTDPRFRWETQANQGVSAARNRALAQCTSEYVTFLDTDDIMRPDRLARCVAAMDARPDTDVLLHFVTLIDAEGRPMKTIWNHWLSRGWRARALRKMARRPVEELLLGRSFPPCAAAFRTEALRQIEPFDPMLRIGEDTDLWIRLAAHGAVFAWIPYTGASYRRHQESASQQLKKSEFDQSQLMDKTFSKTLAGHPAASLEPVARAILPLKLARKTFRAGLGEQHAAYLEQARGLLQARPLTPLERRAVTDISLVIPGCGPLLRDIGAGRIAVCTNGLIDWWKRRRRGARQAGERGIDE